MLTLLHRCLDYGDRIVAGIPDHRRRAPTPCEGYDVERLVGHLVNGMAWFAGLPGGGPRDPIANPDPDLTGVPLIGAYREAATAVRAEWSPEHMGEVFQMPHARITGRGLTEFLIIELLGHGWDLAVATGQPADAGGDLAEEGLRVAHDLGDTLRSPGMMSDPVPTPPDAPAMDRLVAFLGRTPRF